MPECTGCWHQAPTRLEGVAKHSRTQWPEGGVVLCFGLHGTCLVLTEFV
jgi:hypothetical protein